MSDTAPAYPSTAASSPAPAQTPTAPSAPPSPAPAAPTPAPAADQAVTLSRAELQGLIDQAVAAGAASSAGAPAPAPESPANPPSKESLFEKGNLVSHSWYDPYDDEVRTRHGIVIETVAADPETEASYARSVVGWFEAVSGPIGDHELEAD